MKIKTFDVVQLHNENKATILEETDKGTYKVEIVNNEGKTQGITEIDEKDIIKVIFSK